MAEYFDGTSGNGNEGATFAVPDYTTQRDLIKERKARAKALLEQSMADGGKMVGNIYVRKNPWVSAIEGFVGGYQNASADTDAKKQAAELASVQNELLKRMAPEQQAAARAAMTPGLEKVGGAMFQHSLKDAPQGFTLSEGQQRFDKDGKPLASLPPKAEKPTAGVAEYNFAKEQGFTGSFTDFLKAKSQAIHMPRAEQRDRFQIVQDTDGSQYRVNMDSGEKFPIGLTKPPKAEGNSTESERSAAGYLGRMQAAEKGVSEINDGNPTYLTGVAAAIPGVGEDVRKAVATVEQNRHKQYADDWIRAKLRKESGAVIGDAEMKAEYETYFPQRGDSPAIVKQKAQARAQAAEQMRTGAGRVKPTTAAPVQPGVAPKAALDFLKANPSAKEAFKAKYGYLPEGY